MRGADNTMIMGGQQGQNVSDLRNIKRLRVILNEYA